jgi:uncharacterized protein (DUF1499 family)
MFIAKPEQHRLSHVLTGQEQDMSEQPTGEQQPTETVADVPPMADPVAEKKLTGNYGGKLVLVLGAGSILLALIGALGSGWGLWHFSFGFRLLMAALAAGVLAILIGAFIGWRAKRKGVIAPRPLRWLGMALGGAFAVYMLSMVYTARSVPAIHDISTDLADPPQYKMLALREDYLDNIPGIDDPEMRGLNPLQRWAAIHAKSYGDIRSVRIAMPVADTIAKAERIAKERGWEIVLADPVEGRLEATDTTRFFRFKDDVVLRVRPADDGTASIIDMRSISRVGQSDLGVNAKRVRAFLADMAGTNPAG